MKKSLSVLALLLSLVAVLSFGSLSAYAESSDVVSVDASVDASIDASVDASADVSADASEDASADDSEDASADASDDASKETSKEESKDAATDNKKDDDDEKKFPWALVIFLAIVVIVAVVCFVCIKLDNVVGRWLKNFFKDYKSEIKKVTWPSKEVTIKSTIVVLVCLIVSGAVVGLLDFGLAKLIELFRDLVSK